MADIFSTIGKKKKSVIEEVSCQRISYKFDMTAFHSNQLMAMREPRSIEEYKEKYKKKPASLRILVESGAGYPTRYKLNPEDDFFSEIFLEEYVENIEYARRTLSRLTPFPKDKGEIVDILTTSLVDFVFMNAPLFVANYPENDPVKTIYVLRDPLTDDEIMNSVQQSVLYLLEILDDESESLQKFEGVTFGWAYLHEVLHQIEFMDGVMNKLYKYNLLALRILLRVLLEITKDSSLIEDKLLRIQFPDG